MNLPADMIAIAIAAPGGPEMLQPVRQPIPDPRRGEVLIRVAAAGLNAPDLGQRRGTYAPPPGASPLPGLEVSGEVVALGDDAQGHALGDRVVALTNGGGYAEYVAVPAGQVLPLPSGWTLLEGATIPETWFTVEQTLVMRAGLAPGMFVLIHGGAGGIGGAAIQSSRLHGARPIAVVSSAEKAAYATSLGAEAVIRHDTEDFVARIMVITADHGADRIIDMVAGENLDRNLAAAARFGHLVLLATAGGPKAEINAARLMMKQLTLSGSTLRPQTSEAKAAIAASLGRNAWSAFADGRILKPRIRHFDLADAPAAHRALETRSNFGKIVLVTRFGHDQSN
jgi:putative PIG3 family NAD(P)H quinone oxidoreductase